MSMRLVGLRRRLRESDILSLLTFSWMVLLAIEVRCLFVPLRFGQAWREC
jgi:hypothetical protein